MSLGSFKGTQKSFAVRPPPLSSFVLVSRASCRVMWTVQNRSNPFGFFCQVWHSSEALRLEAVFWLCPLPVKLNLSELPKNGEGAMNWLISWSGTLCSVVLWSCQTMASNPIDICSASIRIAHLVQSPWESGCERRHILLHIHILYPCVHQHHWKKVTYT